MMNPPVQKAIDELNATFAPSPVIFEEDGEGGAYVTVEKVDLNGPYDQNETWIGFHITAQFPYSDIYPVFVRSDLRRKDGGAFGTGIAPGHNWRNRGAAIQVSRKSNGRDPMLETAPAKILKVRVFMETR